jgi:hypothetical protein
MQSLSELSPKEGMVCGRCDRPATCALHDTDTLATSAAVFFLCGTHLKERLERHPKLHDHLQQKLGPKALHALFER